MTWIVQDRFFGQAQALRRDFEGRFSDPRSADSRRFVWDYWHVPEQYTVVRTPAYHFFQPKVYRAFEDALLRFGRERLGCTGITPPWLSYYVEGCRQELHADVPHGPWAFVFSLTPWKDRHFNGGETLIFRPSTLDYWRSFSEMRGVEQGDLVEKIPAEFNRLLVFDPRIPHGVTEVRGTHDPREARLVIHGWFTDPQPTIDGALSRSAGQKGIAAYLEQVDQLVSSGPRLHGMLCIRLDVSADGSVRGAKLMVSTLKAVDESDAVALGITKQLVRLARGVKFPKARGASRVTLPLVFRWED